MVAGEAQSGQVHDDDDDVDIVMVMILVVMIIINKSKLFGGYADFH